MKTEGCHPGESRDPEIQGWIPAFAGMTDSLLKSLASLVFLHRCIGCESWIEENKIAICENCFARLHFLKVPAFLPHLSKKYFDNAYSALAYEGLVLDWVHRYKYHRKFYLGPVFVQLLSKSDLDWEKYDAIVPVPLHWWRRLRRGFNQSHLLAHLLSRQIQKPVATLLKKRRLVKSQTELSSGERLKNVRDAFAFKLRKKWTIRNAKLLLIDDVLTTGATVNECAKVLRKAGAATVDVLTLARPL